MKLNTSFKVKATAKTNGFTPSPNRRHIITIDVTQEEIQGSTDGFSDDWELRLDMLIQFGKVGYVADPNAYESPIGPEPVLTLAVTDFASIIGIPYPTIFRNLGCNPKIQAKSNDRLESLLKAFGSIDDRRSVWFSGSIPSDWVNKYQSIFNK